MKAINQIISELIAEGAPDQDPQVVQARDLLDRIRTQFLSATRETFTTIHFPITDRLMNADFLMEFTSNRYHGEEQVTKTLQAKQKYTDDITGDTFRLKTEQRLFTQKVMLWSEIRRRAAMNTAWQWHKAEALDKLKEDCVHKDKGWQGERHHRRDFSRQRAANDHGQGQRRGIGQSRITVHCRPWPNGH